MSTSGPDSSAGTSIRPRLLVEQLLAAKAVRPIRSLDEFVADTFESDEELLHRRKLTGHGSQLVIQ